MPTLTQSRPLSVGSETNSAAVRRDGKPLQSLGFTSHRAAGDIGHPGQGLVFEKALSGRRHLEAHGEKIDTPQGWFCFAQSHLAILLKKRTAGGAQFIGLSGARVGRKSE